MEKLTLHGMAPSPATRAILLTLKALNLQYEFHEINVSDCTPEFLKGNPQYTVLNDGEYGYLDSHAVTAYLVNKYGQTDELYPKDPQKRALVDQRLHYNSSFVSVALRNIIQSKDSKISSDHMEATIEVLNCLEDYLDDHVNMGGDSITIADFNLLASTTSLGTYLDINSENYPKIFAWIEGLKKLPYYNETNGKGLEELRLILNSDKKDRKYFSLY